MKKEKGYIALVVFAIAVGLTDIAFGIFGAYQVIQSVLQIGYISEALITFFYCEVALNLILATICVAYFVVRKRKSRRIK